MRELGEMQGPILEIGCGNGMFTELAGLRVDHAVDREQNAVRRAAARLGTYSHVSQIDAHDLSPSVGRFETIFSNSVLEHIPDLPDLLARCHELLSPGGRLVATVPLLDMNEHLALRREKYVRRRQRHLVHLNLWSVEEWRARLHEAGFERIEAIPYLDAGTCRRWDRLDALGGLGFGRYRLAALLHVGLKLGAPRSLRERIERFVARVLMEWAERPRTGPGCAAIVIATARP